MKFFETSKYYTLKKSTYITLRWIGIIGQLVSINLVYFYFNLDFNFIYSNIIIFIGILSNFYLIVIYQKTQLSDRTALSFLLIDIFQLASLIYLTGGVVNPFIIFLIIPSVFASSNLGIRTNFLLVITTILIIVFLTFYSNDLPKPLSNHFHVDPYYYYSIPVALIIALIFLNYFAIIFGSEMIQTYLVSFLPFPFSSLSFGQLQSSQKRYHRPLKQQNRYRLFGYSQIF